MGFMIHRLIPFCFHNQLYGERVEVEDLINRPLKINERLMRDNEGFYHRISIPEVRASLSNRIIYWIQTHLNTKWDLEAIPDLIIYFNENILKMHLEAGKNLEHVFEKGKKLKEDLHLNHKSTYAGKTIEEMDVTLKKLEDEVNRIKENEKIDGIIRQEDERKKKYTTDYQEIEKKIAGIKANSETNLKTINLLMTTRSYHLQELFEKILKSINLELDEVEKSVSEFNRFTSEQKKYKGFPFTEQLLNNIKIRIKDVISLIALQIETAIKNLNINGTIYCSTRNSLELIQLIKKTSEKLNLLQQF
jgi:hypothetical protein